jgi:hypothetical protein
MIKNTSTLKILADYFAIQRTEAFLKTIGKWEGLINNI